MLTIVIDCADGARLLQTLYASPRVLERAIHQARKWMSFMDSDDPIRADIHVGGHDGSNANGPIVATVYPIPISFTEEK